MTAGSPLRILLVEDNPDDAELLVREVERAGYEPVWERVETGEEMRLALLRGRWDLIISDFSLPTFSAPDALETLQRSGRDIPLVIVSGTIDEVTAVESLRAGAQDFVVKGNLARLVPAIERELADAAERRARRRAEEGLRRRDAVLGALGAAAAGLLGCEDWREAVDAVLAGVGEATAADHVFLYAVDAGSSRIALRHEWVGAAGVPLLNDPEVAALTIPAATLERWFDDPATTRQGSPTTLVPDAAEFFERYGVRSSLIAPIVVDRAPWGLLGLSQITGDRTWTAAESDALRTVAGAVAAAVQRSQDEAGVERQLARIRALREIDRSIIGRAGLGATLRLVLDQALDQFAVDAASILLFPAENRRMATFVAAGLRAPDRVRRERVQDDGRLRDRIARGGPASVVDLAREPGVESLVRDEGFRGCARAVLKAEHGVAGVLEVFSRDALALHDEELDFLDTLAGQAELAVDHVGLIEDLRQMNLELARSYDATLEAWARLLDLRDRETEGHSRRVTEMAVDLARELGLAPEEIVDLRRGALLHDIGKLGIPDRILQKPGPLDDSEWEVMRTHPILAHEFLQEIPFLQTAIDIPYLHHEKWDGTGYPLGLKGEDIPLGARIFAVADVWDALRSERPYRPAMPHDEVVRHISSEAGTHFDPAVVAALERVLERAASDEVA